MACCTGELTPLATARIECLEITLPAWSVEVRRAVHAMPCLLAS